MAPLEERSGSCRFIFRCHGKQLFVTIGKLSPGEADVKAAQEVDASSRRAAVPSGSRDSREDIDVHAPRVVRGRTRPRSQA
jgi:hypothetical protein